MMRLRMASIYGRQKNEFMDFTFHFMDRVSFSTGFWGFGESMNERKATPPGNCCQKSPITSTSSVEITSLKTLRRILPANPSYHLQTGAWVRADEQRNNLNPGAGGGSCGRNTAAGLRAASTAAGLHRRAASAAGTRSRRTLKRLVERGSSRCRAPRTHS